MSLNVPKLYFGTAGWSYKDWMPSFYPYNQSKDFDWLEFYSDYFNVVEVNSSFYTFINPHTIEEWVIKTSKSDEFLFTIKLHQNFTHIRNFNESNIKSVRNNLDILTKEERLGGLLIQFPYSFECNSGNIEYMRKIISLFEGYERFVEIRHGSWKNKRAKTVTFCSVDQPQLGNEIEFKPNFNNDTAYLRFHGRNESAWLASIKNINSKQSYDEQNARYDYLYSPGEIVEISLNVKEIFDKVKKIFVIMNNHPHGNATANAFELMHLLKNRMNVNMPETVLSAFPRLKRII